MNARTAIAVIAVVVTTAGVGHLPAYAQSSRPGASFDLPFEQNLHVGTACPGDLDGLSITLINQQSLAGQFVTYTAFAEPAGIIGFSASQSGPFEDSLEVTFALDATGSGKSSTFYYRAMAPGTAVVRGCNQFIGCLDNPFSVTVVGVDAVVIVEADSPLDVNPNAGGGLRIYPGKQFPSDAADRRVVRVQAFASEPRAGVRLYFESFDLDDPSSDARPVDPNGSDATDNRGFPNVGTLGATSALTDAFGVAEVAFAVTVQPGDNFRLAASCRSSYLGGARAIGTDVVDADGIVLPTERAAVSEMLTVWRRLHVEVDSMGLVTGNRVTGSIVAASTSLLSSTTDLMLPQTFERGRFENGVITIDGVGTFRVIDSSRNKVEIEGVVSEAVAVGRAFVLVDDDDLFGDDPELLRDGDEGENVPPPSMLLLADGLDNGVCDGSTINVFGPAYVCPTFDVGDDEDFVPFVLNTPDSEAGKLATYDFDQIATEADPAFWTVYLMGAYQLDTDQDLDPSGELKRSVVGTVDARNGVGVSIFQETIADAARSKDHVDPNCTDAVLVVHELGHLFNGVHPDGGIMSPGCSKMTLAFTARTLATIREIEHP